MPFPIHTLEVLDGSNSSRQDRVLVAMQSGVANASGAAGATVSTVVTFAVGELPANYVPVVNPGHIAVAAGTFDVAVIA